FDTLYAEGQRRYMESLSSYARQFLGNIEKPDVDYIEGLSPAIAIDQLSAGRSPRSTVGTMSDVYDYLRLLFVRVGTPYCPTCGARLKKDRLLITKNVGANQPPKPIEKDVFVCYHCDWTLPEVSLGSFSFNSPTGACPDCQGLGVRLVIEPDLVVPNPRLTLEEGAIRPWVRTSTQSAWYKRALDDFAARHHVSLATPVGQLPKPIRRMLFFGAPDGSFEGVIPNLERRYRETDSDYLKREIEKYMVRRTCPTCQGQRLRPEVLSVRLGTANIVEIVRLSIDNAVTFFTQELPLENEAVPIAAPILRELRRRLRYLADVGLGYLTLDRNADTLAGGEAQRIRLATQLGSQLAGVVYILDEPSIGLHPRDQTQLITALRTLRDLGNTVIVVEHDDQTIRAADWVIDVGPGAGQAGGRIIAAGTPTAIMEEKASLTGQYLRGTMMVPVPAKRRRPGKDVLEIQGAQAFNLQNIDITIPLGLFICVSGVSGSGKSTLVDEILAKALAKRLYRAKAEPGRHTAILGIEAVDKVIAIDQSPIGRTPRSNPATYVNFFGLIRDLYAALPAAKEQRLKPSHFSFNLRGGRCEQCRGEGLVTVEMHFLPDLYMTCSLCGGTRYKPEVLTVRYLGKTIAEVLDMTVTEATKFFTHEPQIVKKLAIVEAVGLGYVKLGQPATTLSGGEAQRIKLATELARPATGRTLYILDEPTTGLHFEDVRRLLGVLQALVDKGNTVLVIEHNVDVMKSADWIIDLGPEGGTGGGHLVAAGPPEKVAQSKRSATAPYLAEALRQKAAPALTKKPAALAVK
ncbi:excinuclease ABC subunit UvrA, partial [Candidatus Berkelbacteria bacterium]|nr:excinuclease ABC subunit UvrA [Candidatus Berkelbacteria bacterium]